MPEATLHAKHEAYFVTLKFGVKRVVGSQQVFKGYTYGNILNSSPTGAGSGGDSHCVLTCAVGDNRVRAKLSKILLKTHHFDAGKWSMVPVGATIGLDNEYLVVVPEGTELRLMGSEIKLELHIDTLMAVPRELICTAPVLVNGAAACGKTTLAAQYAYHLATDSADVSLVPLRTTALELAETIELEQLSAEDDILGAHIRANPH